ncbi:RNA polymerase sigma-H factor [Emticicia aquatica]|uniref:RNA polymerase sigma-H factor n=1 Tax=Emticicia aquatica TaxID=1681835 RepID=A0ABN8ETN0_9BACT|nr:RNA polymerase sigma factor [Emticicia aquatica]CAH0994252.1 RNA polymerase sigma-H factor [Emticicia aquatica]
MIPNQADIIKRCLKGDEKAFRKLYDTFSSRMLGVCKRYARETAEAEDLLQEGFMKVYEQLSGFKNDGSLEGWIYRIIVNNAIDSFRKNQRMQTVEISEIHDDNLPFVSSNDILSAINTQELLESVRQLPRQYGIIFNLYVFEGYKYYEIAEQLKISEGTVKSNLFDARRLLKEKVTKLFDMKDTITSQTK